MNIIDKATAHYANQDRLIITVPEWDTEIHFFPMTMAEINMMGRIASKKTSNIEQAANMIVTKAKDKDGNRLFTVKDRDRLMNEVDYRVVLRIAEKIDEHFFGDMEEIKGNSNAIQPAEIN